MGRGEAIGVAIDGRVEEVREEEEGAEAVVMGRVVPLADGRDEIEDVDRVLLGR